MHPGKKQLRHRPRHRPQLGQSEVLESRCLLSAGAWVVAQSDIAPQSANTAMAVQGSSVAQVVSYNADARKGFSVDSSTTNLVASGSIGTSIGAPHWPALIAIAQEAQADASLAPVASAVQTLPVPAALCTDPSAHTPNGDDVGSMEADASSHAGMFAQRGTNTGDGSTGDFAFRRAGILIRTLSDAPSEGWFPPSLDASPMTSSPGPSTPNSTAGGAVSMPPSSAAPAVIVEFPRFLRNSSDVPNEISIPVAQPPAPPAASSTPGPALATATFSDALIRHNPPPPAVTGIGPIELPGSSAIRQATALALAGGWAGQADVSMVSWFVGADKAAAAMPGLPAVPHADVVWGIAARAAADGSPAAEMVTALATPILNEPMNALYRFANFDPVATFADGMADFARESASMSPLHGEHRSHRPCIITGLVLTADALLLARWYVSRRKKSAVDFARWTGSGHATNPESPQAGLLPTGL